MQIDSITSLFIFCRYDSTTGTFTVPSDGDGLYYFSVYLVVIAGKWSYFDLQLNGEVLCTAFADNQETMYDEGQSACSTTVYVVEGR